MDKYFFKKIFTISIVLSACLAIGAAFFLFEYEWVDFSQLEHFLPAKPSIILDDQGDEFARFELDKRELVTYEKLPDILVKAFIAAEDHNFFSHNGISLRGIIRSFLVNLYNWRVVQGASTITQQLAKLIFLSYDRSFLRKFQEIFLSFQIERHFTKKQILQLYVNNVYFGRGVYGVAAASRRFWNKSVLDLSVDEAATLASVAKSARLYSPLNALENAKRRRDITLKSMKTLGFISLQESEEAMEKELLVEDYLPGNRVRLYIQEWIRQWAEQEWGREILYKNGLKIKTTINKKKQDFAEKLFCKKVEELRPKVGDELNGGMIAIESNTGKIKVCIGGYDFRESQFNRAFQAVRQVGSSFKPIVYAAALQSGLGMDTVMLDSPITMTLPGNPQAWRPRNWTHRFEGEMTLVKALSYSNNIITIKTLMQTGVERIVELARKFGIRRELTNYPSLALGTAEATVEENVAAFNVFANNGIYVKPFLVESVRDEWGRKLWEHEAEKRMVLDSKTNSKMVNALAMRLKQNKRLLGLKNWIDAEVIGKTGSTNEAGTTWYVGATPELTTAVYLGRDDNKPMGKFVFGYQTAYPIWFDFYRGIKFKKKQFYVDPELKEVLIDWNSGDESENRKSKSSVTILK
ncbi:PBP1A family penicillin-binding protein [Candidatus Babeliales bacterium]|nr:PBP1A family penicillin-binding protein [Candidatus Babeliales bacterium]